MTDLSIIIVSHNTKELLINCLESVFEYSGKIKVVVYVVDNASNDGSPGMVKKYYPKVKVIQNKKNYLYSKANNQALKLIKGKYFLILNSDTLIHKHTLSDMVNFLDKRPNCALASCLEKDMNGKTILTCHKFHTPVIQILDLPIFNKFTKNFPIIKRHYYKGWTRVTTRKVDTIPGSFIFGRSSIVKDIGGFDENLPLFFSDADLCKRVSDLGYDIYHNGDTAITHFKAQSLNNIPYLEVINKSNKDMVYYYRKYYGDLWASLILLLVKINFLILSIKIKYRI